MCPLVGSFPLTILLALQPALLKFQIVVGYLASLAIQITVAAGFYPH